MKHPVRPILSFTRASGIQTDDGWLLRPRLGAALLSALLLAMAAFALDDPPPGAPQTDSVEPKIARAGTLIKVKGSALDKAHIEEVYLTDHRFDMKVKVLEQTSTGMTLRVPPFVKPGRLQLLYLTAGSNPVFLEQPFYVLIEEGEDPSAPTPVTKGPKPGKSLEVAATGAAIPVPPANSPLPMTSAPQTANVQAPEGKVQAEPEEKKPEPPPPAPPVAISKAEPLPQVPAPATPAPAPPNAPPQPQGQQPSQQQQAVQAGASGIQQPGQGARQTEQNIVPAQVLRRSRVVYPAAAQNSKTEGAVELIAVVGPNGKVKEVRVLKGNPYLASAAIVSVRDWLYEPARVDGVAVESEVSVVLNFKRPH